MDIDTDLPIGVRKEQHSIKKLCAKHNRYPKSSKGQALALQKHLLSPSFLPKRYSVLEIALMPWKVALMPRNRLLFIFFILLLFIASFITASFFLSSLHIAETNPIRQENQLAGTTSWLLSNPSRFSNYRYIDMEGYPWKQSAVPGETLSFSVSTTAQSFTADVYRLGWYGGAGARFLKTISNIPGHFYPLPQMDLATGLMDANWPAAFSLFIDPSWTTGKYLVKLTGSNGKQGYIPFVVRSARKAALLFVLSDNTAQAYNDWGGKSTYPYNSAGKPAYKVSFNRPYATGANGLDVTFVWEYPMIRWLEQQGYDVEYASSVDLAMNPSLAKNHKGAFVAGHSEYWSRGMFNNFLAARDSGVNIAFFSGDNIRWRVRYENASNNPNPTPNRILVAYKSATADPVKDPELSTTDWGAERRQLLGNDEGPGPCNPAPCYEPLIVTNAASWIYAGTGAKNGDLIGYIVGYEWDNTTSTANMVAESKGKQKSTLYKATSGAYVFDAGTIEWPFGLDSWGTGRDVTTPLAQKITKNILDNFVTSSLITL